MSEETIQWVVLGITIIVGFLTQFITAHLNYKMKVNEMKLARLNEQINKLYGPLRMLDIATYEGVNWQADMMLPKEISDLTRQWAVPVAVQRMACMCEKDGNEQVSATREQVLSFKKMCADVLLKNVTEMTALLKENTTLLDGLAKEWVYELELHRKDLKYNVESWKRSGTEDGFQGKNANDEFYANRGDETSGFEVEGFDITDRHKFDHPYPVEMTQHITEVFKKLKMKQARIFGKISDKDYELNWRDLERRDLQTHYIRKVRKSLKPDRIEESV